jgi:hypothetical protein
LFRGGVVGVGVFLLQVLEDLDEDGLYLRVLVEEGILVSGILDQAEKLD